MFGFENQAPWTQAALKSILGAQGEQPQGMQTPPAQAPQMPNPLAMEENTHQKAVQPNVGGMQAGPNQSGQQMVQAPTPNTQNDPLMSSDSFLNPDQKLFKQWGQFVGPIMGNGQGGMGGMGGMMML